VPALLLEAGLSAASIHECRVMLADMLSAKRPSPGAKDCDVSSAATRCHVTLEVLWDAVNVTLDRGNAPALQAVFAKYSNAFEPGVQDMLKAATSLGLRELDAALSAETSSIDALRRGTHMITSAVAKILIDFYESSTDRVIHEEIAGMMALQVTNKAARAMLGQFLIAQFPVPAKRTHRFVLCQALLKLAEPELGDGLAKLARDTQFASLRGRLCEALAKCKHPNAAEHIAAALKDGDDETKLCAIEALGELKAAAYKETVRGYTSYQSSDKEWTRAIKKAAEKALKRM